MTHYICKRKGPYFFLSADYGTDNPREDDYIVINGPTELSDLIYFEFKLLEQNYPGIYKVVEKIIAERYQKRIQEDE
jgi:hypothetical protein